MNLLTIFCYITAACDVPAAAAQRAPLNAIATPATTTVAATNGGRKTVRQTSSYPTRYDYIDVEAVMGNDRILKILFNCVMSRGPCTREGLELKRIIPDAIQTECSKCSERQRIQAGKVLAHLLTYKPEMWKMLTQKFDPNNIYLKKYMSDEDDEKTSLQKVTNSSKTN